MGNFIKRNLWDKIVIELDKHEIGILLGPRQVGKTTLFFKLISYLEEKGVNKKNIFYYSFDDVELRALLKKDFFFLQKDIEQKIGISFENIQEKVYLFLDEGQKAPTIFEFVKILYDKNYPIKIFISGSSSINIRKTTVETLSGRVSYFHLSPTTFSEIIGKDLRLYSYFEDCCEETIQSLTSEGFRNLKDYERILTQMLFSGCLPKIYFSSPDEKITQLNNFLTSYLEKDIKDIEVKVSLENFHLSFKYLSSYCAELLNFSKISQDLGIKRDSLYRYFELLEKTMVLTTISSFMFPQIKYLFKSRKLFFFDSGVVNRLRGFLDIFEVERAGFMGKIFEQFIFQNLYAHTLNDEKKPCYYYFRDYQNHEIDLIYQRGDKTVPIEISYTTTITSSKIRNFNKFFRLYPKALYGIIFYRGRVQVLTVGGKKVFAVPFFLV